MNTMVQFPARASLLAIAAFAIFLSSSLAFGGGHSLSFNGGSTYVIAPVATTTTGDFTMECWVNW
ncbi:MAG TPA: hypothetical protein VKS81_06715, partial [Bacteroidota bacterium]|nr:hypothetical protein [Bacteroidota bacterium]